MEASYDQNKIFHLYTKYRHVTYNKILTSNEQISKFKEKITNYHKIFKEITKNKFKQQKPNDVMIYIKEDKETKVILDNEQKEDEQKEDKKEDKKEEKKEEQNEDKKKEKKEENEKKQKTFLLLGNFKDIEQALVKRGWKRLTDENDRTFDYIYTIKSNKVPHQELKPNQMAGHFWKANEITRKTGLLNNMKNLYFKEINIDNFFPRGYELTEKNDFEDFIEDFKTNKAISILKDTLFKKGINVNKEVVQTAISIVKRKLPILKEEININDKFNKVKGRFINKKDDKDDSYEIPLITDQEWEIISNEDMEIYNDYIDKLIKKKLLPNNGRKINKKNIKKNIESYSKKDTKNKTENNKENNINNSKPKDLVSKEKTDDEKKLEEEFKEMFKQKAIEREIERQKENEKLLEEEIKRREKELLDEEEGNKNKEENQKEVKKYISKEEKEKKWKEDYLKENKTHPRPNTRKENENCENLLPEIEELLTSLKKYLPEYSLEGKNNIWIVKPGGKSRGRGIHCIDQLNDILSDVKLYDQTVIQKYIENPLIIHNRKFDIRQWVLVTDLSPLTIWMFDTPYVRFSAEDFNISDFKNIFSQLTNNSVAKHSEKYNETSIIGDMWEIDQFSKFLIENYGKDYWPEMKEKIKKIVIYSLQSAKHKIFQRKNNHEMFGYDIMVDDKLNVYLIEINASPDWTYSTQVTEKLVKIASEDLIKVVVDYADEQLKDEKDRKEIDTGRFKLIFNSNDFPKFDNMEVNFHEIERIKKDEN